MVVARYGCWLKMSTIRMKGTKVLTLSTNNLDDFLMLP